MLYLILLLPAALAVCCCVLRPDGGRARSAVLLAVQGAELLLVLLAVCRGAELVSPVWHMSEALTFSLRLDRLAGDHPLLAEALAALDRAIIDADDAETKLHEAARALEYDPDRLEAAETRLFELRAMARKHGCQPDDLPALAEDFSARLDAIEGGGAGLAATYRRRKAAK